MGKSGKQKNKH